MERVKLLGVNHKWYIKSGSGNQHVWFCKAYTIERFDPMWILLIDMWIDLNNIGIFVKHLPVAGWINSSQKNLARLKGIDNLKCQIIYTVKGEII